MNNGLGKFKVIIIWATFLPIGILFGVLLKSTLGEIYLDSATASIIMAIPTLLLMFALVVTGYLFARRFPVDY